MSRNHAPPRVPFGVSVGVTGHRSAALARSGAENLEDRIRAIFQRIEERAGTVRGEAPGCFDHSPTTMRLVTPLADGADQLAAKCALDLGWQLQAILPFERGLYRQGLRGPDSRDTFDRLIAQSCAVLELPGDPRAAEDAYVLVGRGTVAHCDVLLAVWDGAPARGRGGTAEVVQFALTRGSLVIHLHPDSNVAPTLLWSAFDPEVQTVAREIDVERPWDVEHLDRALRGLTLLPPDPNEARFLDRFYGERRRWIRTRIEYPLMLALTGVRRFSTRDFRERPFLEMLREEWLQHQSGCAKAHSIHAPAELLEEAYGWADRLAAHFAQNYRSGHIFGFVLGGIAVCIGLSAFMAPHLKLEFAAGELAITFAVILNAWFGTRKEWHRRWLDYRQLAERLRPMRSLKLLGIAAPDPPGTPTNPVPRRWIEFYANAIWRAIGCPTGALDAERAAKLAASIADFEIAPQMTYHRHNAERVEKLDQRLEFAGFGLFVITLLVSLATMVGMASNAEFVNAYGNWFTLVSAGFPALGTALFGIRFQADFGGDAQRSLATASTLERIDEKMRRGVTLSRAADLGEQAARVMLEDLNEWQLVNQQRELEFG